MQRALFLDRDGTLIHPFHYPTRPEQMLLYEGLGPALQRLQDMGFLLILITNQSGLARGYFTRADLERMHDALCHKLAQLGVRLDDIYYCPHHPDGVVAELARECECRKPRPGLLLQAARKLSIDLSQSWCVGDILDDIEAGRRAGCRTVLVDLSTEQPPRLALRQPDFIARDTCHALRIIQEVEKLQPELNLLYRPHAWLQSPQRAEQPQTEITHG
jgi:D-glycero-D-manno-heptose 1,7-bisphosphate phosphatase